MSEPKKTAVRNNTDQPSVAAEEATSWEHPEGIELVEHEAVEDEDAQLRAEADLGDWGLPTIWFESGA